MEKLEVEKESWRWFQWAKLGSGSSLIHYSPLLSQFKPLISLTFQICLRLRRQKKTKEVIKRKRWKAMALKQEFVNHIYIENKIFVCMYIYCVCECKCFAKTFDFSFTPSWELPLAFFFHILFFFFNCFHYLIFLCSFEISSILQHEFYNVSWFMIIMIMSLAFIHPQTSLCWINGRLSWNCLMINWRDWVRKVVFYSLYFRISYILKLFVMVNFI